ncbi:MAG: 2-oxoglutarate dehydrogenase complex dihydrolipoyllysine-residue succinyltransferase [Gammaproteobacteria bacterium]|nr:2-oxoglutarate dehydrogenase complex dihydrolipoyllysine-residue succinyltransferase [Gammaproteobacteria bacterium]
MAIEIKAPTFPESVADGEIAGWHKAPGDAVQRDELLVEIETDKVVIEVVAPVDGVLAAILKQEGEVVLSEELLATLDATAVETAAVDTGASAAANPAAGTPVAENVQLGPAARRLAEAENIDLSRVSGTGKDGRITKEDLVRHLQEHPAATLEPVAGVPVAGASAAANAPPPPVAAAASVASAALPAANGPSSGRIEKRVPMTRMRKRIASRLLGVSQDTAMLTTFNEVNMAPVMALRSKYKDQFEKTHKGTRLGFMSFFVKAVCEALKRFPAVNASIDGDDVVYHGYQDIGVAVSAEKGLVVPVLRDADFMSMADVEATITELGRRARDGKLSIEDMTGGTFTITNGGVFGSLLSTPILNPPQTGILGMHKIQPRPMAVDGKVVILPMMYLALSYDHRLIDGKDAVQFLAAVKDLIEDPARIMLQL